MKQKQSGFAVVGVAVVALALLAGAAYTFKNAGTDNDPVAFVAKSVRTNSDPAANSGSGSGTKPPCPRIYTPEENKKIKDHKDNVKKFDKKCFGPDFFGGRPKKSPMCDDLSKKIKDPKALPWIDFCPGWEANQREALDSRCRGDSLADAYHDGRPLISGDRGRPTVCRMYK